MGVFIEEKALIHILCVYCKDKCVGENDWWYMVVMKSYSVDAFSSDKNFCLLFYLTVNHFVNDSMDCFSVKAAAT